MTMRVRNKTTSETGEARMNAYGFQEIVVTDWDGSQYGDFLSNYDVLLPDGTWKDFRQALRDHDIITNNANTEYRYPQTQKERDRGYST